MVALLTDPRSVDGIAFTVGAALVFAIKVFG